MPTSSPTFFEAISELFYVLWNSGLFAPTCFFFACVCFALYFVFAGIWNGLPLIGKELREQAARKRTYIVRTIYAIAAILAALLMSWSTIQEVSRGGMESLGKGENLFEVFAGVQFVGIYLFTPALTCSLITSEKERDTLSLLILTRLNPWGIIFGKLLSRILPMLMFAALTLPLCAFAYSLGGVDSSMIASAVYAMILAILQCAAAGVMCSAFFRSTVAAFIGSYFTLLAWLFGLAAIDEFLFRISSPLHELLSNMFGVRRFLFFRSYDFGAMFFPPYLVQRFGGGSGSIWYRVLQSIPILLATLGALYLTRLFLVRRAFVQPKNPLLIMFRLIDRFFNWANNRFGKGITLTSKSDGLPDFQPVAWRETSKKTLGTSRYLVRILVGLEFPVAFLCARSIQTSFRPTEGLSILLFVIWVLAVLLISVASASLVASERSKQTLDVLLTTPLSNRDILKQKFKGVQRMMLVLSIPFLTIYFFETWLKWGVNSLIAMPYAYGNTGTQEGAVSRYLLGSLITTVIYFHMFSMLAYMIGMRVRSQAKAIFVTLGIIVAWCVVPLVIIPIGVMMHFSQETIMHATLLSPASFVVLNEYHAFDRLGSYEFGLIVNTIVYGAITFVLYWYVMHSHHGMLDRYDQSLARAGR